MTAMSYYTVESTNVNQNSKKSKVNEPKIYSKEDAFVAAAVAHRLNNKEYIKSSFHQDDQLQKSNKEIMMDVLNSNNVEILEDDKTLAQQVITHYKGLMLSLLQGKVLTEFQQKAMHLSSADEIKSYDVGVIASLPSCFVRNENKKSVDDRINDCEKHYLGKVGDKVKTTGEVVRCVYSFQWHVFFVTIITSGNQAAFFSSKDKLTLGVTINLTGKVKKHADNFITQLNYTKLI